MENKMTTSIQSLADEDRSALSTLAAALKPFRELGSQFKNAMPVSIVSTFLLIANREGKTVGELANLAGIRLAQMSRQLADLSEKNRYGSEGMGLIEQRLSNEDHRYMRNYLTVKGRALIRQIADAMVRRNPLKETLGS